MAHRRSRSGILRREDALLGFLFLTRLPSVSPFANTFKQPAFLHQLPPAASGMSWQPRDAASVLSMSIQELDEDDEEDFDEAEFESLFEEPVDALEKTWRYAKKPLLSIGSKGASFAQGNSLRQLLEQHTVVKVKVNTRRFDGSLETAFEHLRELAEESGAPKGIEMLQARDSDKIILFGMPGTLERIKKGEFPPQE